MSNSIFTKSIVEDAALTWFGELGYAVGHGPQMAPGEATAERGTFGEVILAERFRADLRQLSAVIPESSTIANHPAGAAGPGVDGSGRESIKKHLSSLMNQRSINQHQP